MVSEPSSSSTMSRVFFIQLVAVIVALLFAFAVFADAQATPTPSASASALPSPVASASPSRSPKASVAPSSASSLNGFLLGPVRGLAEKSVQGSSLCWSGALRMLLPPFSLASSASMLILSTTKLWLV